MWRLIKRLSSFTGGKGKKSDHFVVTARATRVISEGRRLVGVGRDILARADQRVFHLTSEAIGTLVDLRLAHRAVDHIDSTARMIIGHRLALEKAQLGIKRQCAEIVQRMSVLERSLKAAHLEQSNFQADPILLQNISHLTQQTSNLIARLLEAIKVLEVMVESPYSAHEAIDLDPRIEQELMSLKDQIGLPHSPDHRAVIPGQAV